MDPRHDTATCAIFLPSGLPEWIELLPGGAIRGRDNRIWRAEDLARIIQATNDLAKDLPIDFNHAIALGPKGANAPAAGWVRALEVRENSIWGRVEWTPKGAEAVQAGEYRYISPVFDFEKDSRRVIRLQHAGLTNDPNLYLQAVASRGADDMDELLKTLRSTLKLAEDADETAIAEAVASAVNKAGATPELAPIATALGLAEDAEPSAIATAAQAMKKAADDNAPDPKAFVPRSEFDAVKNRLDGLETSTATERATNAVDEAIEAGKLLPANRDWGIAYAQRDREGFAEFVGNQPVLLQRGERLVSQPDPKGGGLSEDELAVCQQIGVSPEDFKKTREAHEEATR